MYIRGGFPAFQSCVFYGNAAQVRRQTTQPVSLNVSACRLQHLTLIECFATLSCNPRHAARSSEEVPC